MILPEFPSPSGCVKVSGFTVYHSHGFAIYTQTPGSPLITDVILADNNVGIWSGLMGPSALSHAFSGKTVTVSNSLIVSSKIISVFAYSHLPTRANGFNHKLLSLVGTLGNKKLAFFVSIGLYADTLLAKSNKQWGWYIDTYTPHSKYYSIYNTLAPCICHI